MSVLRYGGDDRYRSVRPKTNQPLQGAPIMFLSVFDVFKIGVGPFQLSYDGARCRAAVRFLDLILSDDWPRPSGAHSAAITASLHGSLAYTGIGHGTGRAVVLGLMGERPDSVDPIRMDAIIAEVERTGASRRPATPDTTSSRKRSRLRQEAALPGHANGMSFSARTAMVGSC